MPIDTGYAHPTGLPTGATYSVTNLPAGLRIDPKTGAITGTPARAGTSYPVVNATGGGKTISANRFVISVLAPAVPAHVSYPVIRGRVGRPIGDVLPQLAGIVHTTTFTPSQDARRADGCPERGRDPRHAAQSGHDAPS